MVVVHSLAHLPSSVVQVVAVLAELIAEIVHAYQISSLASKEV